VVAHEQLLDAANELALKIAANPPHSVRLTKRLMREAIHARLDSVLELSAVFQAISHKTAHHKEAVDAFIQKRSPDFKD
jgi:enoyl-CoA hydratase/carnithine racemase